MLIPMMTSFKTRPATALVLAAFCAASAMKAAAQVQPSAAERTPQIRKDPRPFVLQKALSDFYVEYELRFHLGLPEERMSVLSELHAQIQDAFNESGVQIMSPHYESQPDRVVFVPSAKWHPAPAQNGGGGDGNRGHDQESKPSEHALWHRNTFDSIVR
jgi:Mechanosensitive ion channel MscS, C-terminal